MNIKEHFKLRLSEAILATNTSRGTQSRMRTARGIDSKRKGSVTPDDHPFINLNDPFNRARLRNWSAAKGAAYERALNTAFEKEFIPKNKGK